MPRLPSSFFTYFVYFDFFPWSLFTFAVLPYPVKSSLLKFDQTSDENVLQSFIWVLTIKLKIFWSWDKFVLEEGEPIVFFFWLNIPSLILPWWGLGIYFCIFQNVPKINTIIFFVIYISRIKLIWISTSWKWSFLKRNMVLVWWSEDRICFLMNSMNGKCNLLYMFFTMQL